MSKEFALLIPGLTSATTEKRKTQVSTNMYTYERKKPTNV